MVRAETSGSGKGSSVGTWRRCGAGACRENEPPTSEVVGQRRVRQVLAPGRPRRLTHCPPVTSFGLALHLSSALPRSSFLLPVLASFLFPLCFVCWSSPQGLNPKWSLGPSVAHLLWGWPSWESQWQLWQAAWRPSEETTQTGPGKCAPSARYREGKAPRQRGMWHTCDLSGG